MPLVAMVTEHVDGLVQDCSNSIANALELLQSCTKPSMLLWINLYIDQMQYTLWSTNTVRVLLQCGVV